MSTTQTYKNLAFISYSRKADSQLASRLQKDLESYSIPTGLTCSTDILTKGRYIRPVFRDHTDLDVRNESFWSQIESELSNSRTLILLCSPASASSANVNREVQSFLGSHGLDIGKVLPIIVGGDISAESGPSQCLPEALRPHRAAIMSRNLPLASDCDRVELTLKAASWMLGVKYDELFRRHRYRQTRQRVILAATAVIVLAVIGVLSWKAEVRRVENIRLNAKAEEERVTADNRGYVGKLRLATNAIDDRRLDAAISALNDCDPKLRDWEWGFLRGEVDQSLARYSTNNGDCTAAASPDGQSLAICDASQSIRVIALADFSETQTINSNMKRVNTISWSHDSQLIAVGSMEDEESGQLAVWDAVSGERKFFMEVGGVLQVQFSPDDTEVFASADSIAHCDISSGELIGNTMLTGGNPAGRFVLSRETFHVDESLKLFAIDYDGRGAFCFDAGSGDVEWMLPISSIDDRLRISSSRR